MRNKTDCTAIASRTNPSGGVPGVAFDLGPVSANTIPPNGSYSQRQRRGFFQRHGWTEPNDVRPSDISRNPPPVVSTKTASENAFVKSGVGAQRCVACGSRWLTGKEYRPRVEKCHTCGGEVIDDAFAKSYGAGDPDWRRGVHSRMEK